MPLTKATQAVIAPNICTTDTVQTVTGAKTFTGNVTTSNLINGTSLCFRNKIINGNFDIWQRGTSLISGTGERFLADRFPNSSVGSSYTASQQSFSNGQTDVPGEPAYFHRTVVSSVVGVNNLSLLAHRIESVKTLAGKTITLSFYAKTDSNKSISIEFTQNFGTGGIPSSFITGIGIQKLNLTTSWQKFTVTANIPSIAGKTIGTDNNDYSSIRFWFDAGSDFNSNTNSLGQQSGTFDIAQVQLEEGSVATPFEIRPIGTELALCQRYYWKGYARTGGTNSNSIGSLSESFICFPVNMRATPTLAKEPDTQTNCISAATLDSARPNGFRYFVQSVNTNPVNYSSTNEAVTASAEL